MKTNKIVIIVVIILVIGISAYFYTNDEITTVTTESPTTEDALVTETGLIYVIGNEPFTQLALRTDDEQIYCLIGDLEKVLWESQGQLKTINGNITQEYCDGGGMAINVIKIID